MLELSAIQYFSYFLDAATFVIGSLLIYSGVLGTFVNPLACNYTSMPSCSPHHLGTTNRYHVVARFFGLPTATAENIVLFPSATGRNLGAGIFVWVMTFLGEKKALGIFLLCWTWAGIADTKVLYEHPQGTSQGMHIRNIFILLLLGPLLIRSSTP
jgi:hypothetical protein